MTSTAYTRLRQANAASRSLYWGTLLLAMVATAGLTACEPRVTSAASTPAERAAALSGTELADPRLQREIAHLSAAGNAAQDASISATVQSQLAMDGELRTSRIHVDTFQGRVALSGSAPNDPARERAAQIAAGVDGVRSIDNRLDVPTA